MSLMSLMSRWLFTVRSTNVLMVVYDGRCSDAKQPKTLSTSSATLAVKSVELVVVIADVDVDDDVEDVTSSQL